MSHDYTDEEIVEPTLYKIQEIIRNEENRAHNHLNFIKISQMTILMKKQKSQPTLYKIQEIIRNEENRAHNHLNFIKMSQMTILMKK